MNQLNIWANSKKVGQQLEELILAGLNKNSMDTGTEAGKWIKNNTKSKTDIDIKLHGKKIYGDVKSAFTPYPSTPTPSKLSNAEHITIDLKDVDKYKDLNVTLYIVVCNYPYLDKKNNGFGIYKIHSKDCWDILCKNPQRQYSRSFRSNKDKIAKVGFSINECTNITEFFDKTTIKKIKKLAEK
jgi:hypothetical protein